MSDVQINSEDFGASEIMGPQLRQFVEKELVDDLKNYKVFKSDLYFDWSNSCAEGHSTNYLDGILENFSYISVLDKTNVTIAEGWLDFIEIFIGDTRDKKVIVFWDFVTIFDGRNRLIDKTSPGIPNHIWEQLDEVDRNIYKNNRQKGKTIGLL
jgi:hypothetical protein